MLDLPDPERLYAALVARDASMEGRALVGVTTTGIFCRLTCPARKPRPEHCRWFDGAAAAVAAGFRPCRRCHPLGPQAEGDATVQRLLAALRDDPGRRWTEGDVAAMGLDPSTARRAFRRHFGVTFLDLARQARLREGVRGLKAGEAVIGAQLDAGFDSASGFRNAFARLFGQPPAAMRGAAGLLADWLDTPLGGMIAVADDDALHLLEFVDRHALTASLRRVPGAVALGRNAIIDRAEAELAAFFAAREARFTVPLALHGTAFEREVWERLRTIPPGETWSYGALAQAIARPAATRAVARANSRNHIAIIVPCHRVIGADGSLTGYAGGLWRKEALIGIEARLRAGA
ncbi:methylated-DNA--[protein]-cysteine S-methyltransferase [Paracoccus sp. S-4012]|nr:methylated-DNA--[protein]-cysteine S-methyltransferase [Paracoccus sp. S-4012]